MAVTIDEMQLDVKSGATGLPSQEPAAATPSNEPVDLRQQMSLLSERKARLQAD
jgi:hypothetical protein